MIALKNVTKIFDGFIALDQINLDIKKGTAFGLLGSNGAGKSTVLRLISGIYKTDSGSVSADGKETYDNPEILKKIFFINDETIQWNNFTMSEMRDYFKTFYDAFSEEKYRSLWNILKLPQNKRLAVFSKGMKRQAVMICALACRPEYLLLDEAFDGLDPTMRIIVKRMLVDEMLDGNMTAVISSHNLKEIDEFCDSAGLLHKGHMVFNRELDSLKSDIQKIQTAFDADVTEEKIREIGLTLLHYSKSGSVVYLIARGKADEINERLSVYEPKFIDAVPLTLEEIFIYEMEVLGYEYTGGIDGLKK
ncbi:MAG: ABC transporter ATP-binding protein [Eubacterium sp.]|jgi:ABC-2 type transport system ATP-binding protein|nr:ABC transporter ATP-binding protein [Eubacterium sp.]